ncbi:STAS/SEC14 domain-containing protein [Colwellia sp. RSH04]|uniref:STAS/SEC14 domain-containing protein n=1 Tax=Colwellia sp. RSH04 TaxID=2305464 RepID=UPI000E567ED4|nr:STAS/SEC14 domain-containing protein [Colwellia sp. RSH04]RHW75395.1 hypothetical protein D1094_13425 [Colwellia sp. RSH04]
MLEHGSFSMEINAQTLIIRCYGAWNIQTVIRMCQEYKEHVNSISDSPWACLVDFTQWELSTPEMWEHIDELNEWGNANNQKFEAVVCSLSIQKHLMEISHDVLTNVDARFFDNLTQAYEWLDEVGVYQQ